MHYIRNLIFDVRLNVSNKLKIKLPKVINDLNDIVVRFKYIKSVKLYLENKST